MGYQQDVVKAFEEFDDCWRNWSYGDKRNQFWHVANSLDTCIDFAVQARKVWSDKTTLKSVQHMIDDSYAVFRDVYSKQQESGFRPGMWWDDYGWWGIAFLKIYDHFDLLWGEVSNATAPSATTVTRAECLDVAKNCWNVMEQCGWTKANDSAPPGLASPVQGGCWNNYPDSPDQGVQNSVTNGLFLTLSIRLFLSTKEHDFLTGAWKEFLWFRGWYARDNQLFNRLNREMGLLLAYERPYDPQKPDYNAGSALPYVSGRMWSGDQGLLIGGLTGLLEAREAIEGDPDLHGQGTEFPTDALDLARGIASGMTWLHDSDRVLHEATLDGLFGSLDGYLIDYSSGKGVFMRYLAYAWDKLNLSYAPYIVATAQAALQYGYRPVNGSISLSWNVKDDTKLPTNDTELAVPTGNIVGQITLQSSRLDALNAAIPLMSNR